jgi:uncharacterized protein
MQESRAWAYQRTDACRCCSLMIFGQRRNISMALKNTTRKTTLATGIISCRSVLSQMKGLMFSRRIEDKALIMVFKREQIVALHMMFVFFPIDIIFADKSRKVVELVRGARPFISQIVPKEKAMYVIELPAGVINKSRTKVGDRLAF